jgi:hypothetical protein
MTRYQPILFEGLLVVAGFHGTIERTKGHGPPDPESIPKRELIVNMLDD